jgi:hypothetical protein
MDGGQMTKVYDMRDVTDAITRKLLDEGKIIGAGWAILCNIGIPKDAPEQQRRLMQEAFYAGAQHLWASIFAGLEDGQDPTPLELQRMDQISAELEAWAKKKQAEQRKRSN